MFSRRVLSSLHVIVSKPAQCRHNNFFRASAPLLRRSLSVSSAVRNRDPDPSKPIYEKLSQRGKVTVITGGARGIGLAIAKTVAELGGDVALFDVIKPQTEVSELEASYGTRFRFYQTDVTKRDSIEKSFANAVQDLGGMNNCVTAAGIALDKPFLEHTWEESLRVLNVNVMGTFFTAQIAAQHMHDRKIGGSIVLIASIAAHCAIPSQRVSIYGALKAGVKLLGKTLAFELAPLNIRVNSLSPGFIQTNMTGDMAVLQPELYNVFNKTPPLRRIGQRDDLTLAVAYLLSDGASYTTGSDLAVTGGLHVGRIQVAMEDT